MENAPNDSPCSHSADLGGLPSTFWWLWTGWLLSALANFVFPFLAFFLTARGFSPSRVGMVVSLFGAGSVIAGPVSGMLADRIGRRPTILLSLLGAAAAAGALAFLSSPLSVGLVVLLFGLTSQAVNAPFQAIVTDLVSPRMRPRAFGLAYWARNLGVSLSLLTGGFLASRGWALPFLADAITTLAFAFVVLRRVPETRPPWHAAASRGPRHREVLADRAFAGFLALHFLFSMAFWQLHAGLPIDMARHGVSPAAFGSVLAVNTILVALLQPFAHRLTGRLAPARALAAGSLLVGLGYGGYALCSTAPQYALATRVSRRRLESPRAMLTP